MCVRALPVAIPRHRAWMISTSLGPIFGLLHTRQKMVHQDRDRFGTAHTSVAVHVTCCCVVLGLTSLMNFAGKFTDEFFKCYIGTNENRL